MMFGENKMALDFMTALRSRAGEQERTARLAGRPLTQVEATAPYVALAETAGERYRTGKTVELAEESQDIQQGQYEKTLSETVRLREANQAAEAARLEEQKRASLETERLSAQQQAETRRISDLQLQQAEDASKRQATASYVQAGVTAATTATAMYLIYTGAIACCFIFVASHGYLHPIVRKYRDNHMNTRNRRGYYWMADRLVPWMEKSKLASWLVEWLMVRPMTCYGRYYYNLGKIGAVFTPVAKFWLIIFTILGMRPPYRRRGTNIVV